MVYMKPTYDIRGYQDEYASQNSRYKDIVRKRKGPQFPPYKDFVVENKQAHKYFPFSRPSFITG